MGGIQRQTEMEEKPQSDTVLESAVPPSWEPQQRTPRLRAHESVSRPRGRGRGDDELKLLTFRGGCCAREGKTGAPGSWGGEETRFGVGGGRDLRPAAVPRRAGGASCGRGDLPSTVAVANSVLSSQMR